MTSRSMAEAQQVIDEGRRLVADARATLAAADRFFAEHEIDPKQAIEELRKQSGDEAVEAAQAEAEALIRGIEEELQRKRMHGGKVRPVGQRARVRANTI
jgi:hypothetical protein